jgi:hypothetical protein
MGVSVSLNLQDVVVGGGRFVARDKSNPSYPSHPKFPSPKQEIRAMEPPRMRFNSEQEMHPLKKRNVASRRNKRP